LEQQQQRGTFDFAVHCHDALSAGGVSALSIAGIDSGGMQASVGANSDEKKNGRVGTHD
jgi:hypothetical protein